MMGPTRTLLPIGGFDITLHDPVVTSTNNGFQLMYETEAMRVMEGRPGYWLAMLAPAPPFGLFGVAYDIGSWTSFSVPLAGRSLTNSGTISGCFTHLAAGQAARIPSIRTGMDESALGDMTAIAAG